MNAGSSNQGTRAPAKPGAMTVAMQAVQLKPAGPKVLRIGLIQGGKIIEERIVRTRETVSVGTSEKNHFVIQAPGMPSRFDLFQLVSGDYILNFTEQMRGRVGLPAGVQELEALRTTGAARHAGTHWQIKLNDNSRGKVVIGETTLLFQFVTPPPVQPRPQLPAAARGGFVKNIDWLFTAFVLFSFMTHFAFVVYLENADWPLENGIDEIPRSIQGLIFNEPPPPEPETPNEEGAAEESAQDAPKAKDTPKNASKEPAPGPAKEDLGSSAEARARIAEEASQAAEALLLGALGDKGGALADVLAGGAVTGNAEDVLAQAAGVGVAQSSSGATLRTRAGGGSGGLGGLGSLAAAGGGGKEQGEGTQIIERVIRGKIDLEEGSDIGGSGDFDSAAVVRMIKTRIKAIQRCYENELRRNPSLSGKVVVEFTIQTTGSVTGAKSSTNTTGDPAVAACVVSTISRFRFNDPAPVGGSVSFSYPFVFAPQN